ncbi:MAG: hypothetical protein ACREIF_02195 [Chthoniobacterales bacterium]
MARCYTTGKLRGGITGKGFVKGDARINRKGRPRGFDELRKRAIEIALESVCSGSDVTTIDAILRSWAFSPEPTLQKAFVEIAYGKVPNKIEMNPLENKTRIILKHAHELSDPETARSNGHSPLS